MKDERKQGVVNAVVTYLQEHQGATWSEIYAQVPSHYCDAASMRASVKSAVQLLVEQRIKQPPHGVSTNTIQQQAIQADGRGMAQGSPDAINVLSRYDHPLPYLSNDASLAAAKSINLGWDLLSRYLDYEAMDDYSELATSLNIYADDATIVDVTRGRMIWATGDDQLVRDIANDLLYRRLDIEADAWAIIRTMCKYGNAVAEIIATPKGVVGLNFLPPASVRKVIDPRGIVLGYVQSMVGNFSTVTSANFSQLMHERTKEKGPNKDGIIVFAPWEIVWWQMPSKQVRAPYGVSIYDAARWAWKRLSMLEDMSMVYLLTRAPARNVIYVDVSDMPPDKATACLMDVKHRWQKKKIIDPATGQLDLKLNVLASDENIFLPTRGGRESTRIDVLSGPEYNIIDQLEYFRDKLFSTMIQPRSYFNVADETTRANLSQKDIMFARTEMRIQRMFMTGLMQVARLHFALLDIDPDTITFGFDMTVPSSVLEMTQISARTERTALAAGMEPWYDKRSILEKVFQESPMDAEEILRKKRNEMITDAEAQGEAQARAAARMPAMPIEEVPPEEAQEAPMSAEERQQIMRRFDVLMERVDNVRSLTLRTQQDMQRMPRVMQRRGRRG